MRIKVFFKVLKKISGQNSPPNQDFKMPQADNIQNVAARHCVLRFENPVFN